MFERFNEESRHVVVIAQDEARRLGHAQLGTEHLLLALRQALNLGDNYIGAEHILLGLVRVDETVATTILLEHGLDADAVSKVAYPERSDRPRSAGWVSGRARGQRWEYRIETWPPAGGADRLELLGRLGAEGWELAGSSTGELIFKRPKR